MILIQWLKFLLLIYNFIFVNKLHFCQQITFSSHFVLIYDSVFRIYDLHTKSYSIIFKNILSSSSLLFFPSSYSFPFILFPNFPFVFFFPHFPFLFFFFSLFASFPEFGLPFPKSAAPVLSHFLLLCGHHPSPVSRCIYAIV